jgi:preprotein translocase subunit Sss1
MFILDISEYLLNGLLLLGVIHYIMYLIHKYWKRNKV